MDHNRATYDKSKSYSLHGTTYELQLIIYFLCKTSKITKCSFKLSTQWNEAEKFDDVVCIIKNTDTEEYTYRLLQLKHNITDNNEITLKTLTNYESNLNFQQFFLSYLKINDRFHKNSNNKLKDLIIFTNRNMDKKLQMNFTDSKEPEHIFNFDHIERNDELKPRRLKLWKNNKTKDNLVKKLREIYFKYKVAKLLVNCTKNDMVLGLEYAQSYLKEENIFDVSRNWNHADSEEIFIKLNTDFWEAKKNKELRNLFFELHEEKPIDEINETVKNRLKKIQIKVTNEFLYEFLEDKDCEENSDDSNGDIEINNFFSKLTLFINQPNVVELTEIVKKEIDDISLSQFKENKFTANILESQILKWMSDKNGIFLTEATMKTFFKDIALESSKLIVSNASKKYLEKMKVINIKFSANCLQNRIDDFRENKENNILCIESSQTTLTACKIEQILNKVENVTYCDSCSLLLNKEHYFNVFNSTSVLHVIEIKENVSEDMNAILQLLNDNKETCSKIILIFDTNFNLQDLLTVNEHDETSILDLSKINQNEILNKIIQFQGMEIQLKQIVSEASWKYFKNEDLWKILTDKLKIGHDVTTLGHIEQYYIKRKFVRNIIMKQEIADKHDFFYIINHMECDTLTGIVHTEQDILIISNDTIDLNNYAAVKNRHWLKLENHDYVWMKTEGSISKLRKYFDCRKLKETGNMKHAFIILAAEPGMGKTTLFNYLLWKEKQDDPSLWTFKINLSNCANLLDKQIFDETVDSFQFLIQSIGLKSSLEINLFQEELCDRGNIILYLDGFDEINETCRENLIARLKQIRTNFKLKQIWISTRLHLKRQLEDAFNLVAYSLKELSQEEQKEFLIKFWNKNDTTLDYNEIEIKAMKTMELIQKSIKENQRAFMGIPLQTRMVAEVFHDQINLPKNIDLLFLYENFIKKKYKIYFHEKIQTKIYSEFLMKLFDDFHKCSSLGMLFHDEITLFGLPILSVSDYNSEDMTQIGLIGDIISGKPQFIHRTFAEYFASKWFASNYKENTVNEHLSNNLFKKDYIVIRHFFDSILINKSAPDLELHRAVLNGDLEKVKELSCNPEEIDRCDCAGRTALHVASYSNIEIFNALLNKNAKSSTSDDLFQCTPLTYAWMSENYLIVEAMLKSRKLLFSEEKTLIKLFDSKGAKLFKTFATHNFIELYKVCIEALTVKYELSYEKHNLYEENMKVAAQYGSLDILKYLMKRILPNVEFINRLLIIAIQNGAFETVNYLIGEGGNVYYKDQKTVLCYAIESRNYEIIECILKIMDNKNFYLNEIHSEIHSYPKTSLDWVYKRYPWGVENCRKTTRILIENGAKDNSNFVHKNDQKRLIMAATDKNWAIVKYLIEERNVPINTYNSKWETSLYYAVSSNNLKEIKYLVDNGAKVEYVFYLIDFSILNFDVIKYLIMKQNNYKCETQIKVLFVPNNCVNLKLFQITNNTDDTNVMHLKYNQVIIKLKLCQSFDVYNDFASKETLDLLVTEQNLKSLDTLDEIILQTKNINGEFYLNAKKVLIYKNNKYGLLSKFLTHQEAHVDDFNRTAIQVIVDNYPHENKMSLLEYFMDNGVDVNSKDLDGNTPLHRAFKSFHLENVKLLISHGAHMDAVNNKRKTILHYASKYYIYQSMETISKIIKKHPHLEFCHDLKGFTPLHTFIITRIKREYYDTTLINLIAHQETVNIKTKNTRYDSPLFLAIQFLSNISFIQNLINKGANVFDSNYHHTILHVALLNRDEDIIKIILKEMHKSSTDLKIFINKEDQDGYTPLMLIVKIVGEISIASLLIESGANVDYVNSNGETALHIAAKWNNHQILLYLLQHHKANKRIKNNNNEMALDIVKKNLEIYPESINLINVINILQNDV